LSYINLNYPRGGNLDNFFLFGASANKYGKEYIN